MEEHAHHSARHTRATIDSRDHFMERLYAVLEKPAEKDGEEQKTKEMFLAYNQLLELSRKLAVQLETLDVSLSSSSSEQDDAWKQLYVLSFFYIVYVLWSSRFFLLFWVH